MNANIEVLKALAECCENGRVERMDWKTTKELLDKDLERREANINMNYMAVIFNDFLIIENRYIFNENYLLKIKQS